VLKILF